MMKIRRVGSAFGLALFALRLTSLKATGAGSDVDHDYQLPQTSPNGNYAVEAAENSYHLLVYRWVEVNEHKILGEVQASYQAEDDGANRSDVKQYAEQAMAYWNKDSRHVVIEEAPKHGSGQTFVLFLASADRADIISVPEEQILAITHEHWQRSRFFFDRWKEHGGLVLTLTGDALVARNNPGAKEILKRVSYNVTLQKSGSSFSVVNVRKTPRAYGEI